MAEKKRGMGDTRLIFLTPSLGDHTIPCLVNRSEAVVLNPQNSKLPHCDRVPRHIIFVHFVYFPKSVYKFENMDLF